MTTINIRIPSSEKRRLTEIATLKGATLSSFLREAALIEARRLLAEFEPHLVKG